MSGLEPGCHEVCDGQLQDKMASLSSMLAATEGKEGVAAKTMHDYEEFKQKALADPNAETIGSAGSQSAESGVSDDENDDSLADGLLASLCGPPSTQAAVAKSKNKPNGQKRPSEKMRSPKGKASKSAPSTTPEPVTGGTLPDKRQAKKTADPAVVLQCIGHTEMKQKLDCLRPDFRKPPFDSFIVSRLEQKSMIAIIRGCRERAVGMKKEIQG